MALLKLGHKLRALHDKPLVDAFADERLAIITFHLEHQAAAVHLEEFGLATDGGAYRASFQVLDVHGDADGGVAFADLVANAHQTGLLHQGNHGGGGKHLQSARAIDGGGVLMLHHKLLAVA